MSSWRRRGLWACGWWAASCGWWAAGGWPKGVWGGVLGEQPEGAGVVCAELDFARLSDCRTQLPALGDRVL